MKLLENFQCPVNGDDPEALENNKSGENRMCFIDRREGMDVQKDTDKNEKGYKKVQKDWYALGHPARMP